MPAQSDFGPLFDFWKLPRKGVGLLSSSAKNSLVVNDNPETVFSKGIVEFEIGDELRPEWVAKGERVPLAVERIPEPVEHGEPLAYFHFQNRTVPAIVRQGQRIVFNFDPASAVDYLTHEHYCTKGRPVYTYLPFHYHKIPFRLQISGLLSFRHRIAFGFKHFPSWPVEKSVDALRFAFRRCAEIAYGAKADANFWQGNDYAVCLSHDTDTAKGFAQIGRFAEIEARFGMGATYNVLANYYKLDFAVLEKLKKAGHEIGWHGYNHDNMLPFLPEPGITGRMESCKKVLGNFNVLGMRSPCLLTSPLMYSVASKFFAYDSSVPDSAVFVSGASNFSGCCTSFPFIQTGKLLEIPLTIPMDADLQYLGYKPKQILDAWLGKLEWIKKVGGLAVINTHTDPHYSGNEEMLGIYEKFLSRASKDKAAMKATCAQAAWHWRREGRCG